MKPVKIRKEFYTVLPIKYNRLIGNFEKYRYYVYLMDWPSREITTGNHIFQALYGGY